MQVSSLGQSSAGSYSHSHVPNLRSTGASAVAPRLPTKLVQLRQDFDIHVLDMRVLTGKVI